jgi:type IV secretory pathway VirB2 component (pilin)
VKVTKRFNKWLTYAAGVAAAGWPAWAYALTSHATLPWDATLTTLQNDIGGPVALAITTAAVIGTGIMWGVSEHVRHVGA